MAGNPAQTVIVRPRGGLIGYRQVTGPLTQSLGDRTDSWMHYELTYTHPQGNYKLYENTTFCIPMGTEKTAFKNLQAHLRHFTKFSTKSDLLCHSQCIKKC